MSDPEDLESNQVIPLIVSEKLMCQSHIESEGVPKPRSLTPVHSGVLSIRV